MAIGRFMKDKEIDRERRNGRGPQVHGTSELLFLETRLEHGGMFQEQVGAGTRLERQVSGKSITGFYFFQFFFAFFFFLVQRLIIWQPGSLDLKLADTGHPFELFASAPASASASLNLEPSRAFHRRFRKRFRRFFSPRRLQLLLYTSRGQRNLFFLSFFFQLGFAFFGHPPTFRTFFDRRADFFRFSTRFF